MLLTQAEAQSLTQATHRSPHELLGMHPLADGSGVVVRALLHNAARVEARPTHEKDRPVIRLKKLDTVGLYEGTTAKANKVGRDPSHIGP